VLAPALIIGVRNGCWTQHNTSSEQAFTLSRAIFDRSLVLPAIAGNKTGIGLFTSMSAKAFPRWMSPLQSGPMVDQLVAKIRVGIDKRSHGAARDHGCLGEE
jgi:hypothetical protein